MKHTIHVPQIPKISQTHGIAFLMLNQNRFFNIRCSGTVKFFLFFAGIFVIFIVAGTAFAQWQNQYEPTFPAVNHSPSYPSHPSVSQPSATIASAPQSSYSQTFPSAPDHLYTTTMPNQSNQSNQATPFAPATVSPDPTLSNAQVGANRVSEIVPTINSPQYDAQMTTVPIGQNHQYLDPTISDLHPQELAAEELPDTWRMNSTLAPDPTQYTDSMDSINPWEIQQSQQELSGAVLDNRNGYDSNYITGSQNFQEPSLDSTLGLPSDIPRTVSNTTPSYQSQATTTPTQSTRNSSPFYGFSDSPDLIPVDASVSDNSEVLVHEIKIEGNGGVPYDSIRKKIKTMEGRPYLAQVVEDDVRTLLNTSSFSMVAPYVRFSEEGATVVFRLIEKPLIHFVKVQGNNVYTKEELKEEIGIKPGDPMDVSVIQEGRDRIEAKYIMDGFNRVHVEILEGYLPTDRGVVYSIDEGVKQRILKTKFSGNSQISSGRLKTLIESKPGIGYYIGGEFSRDKLDADAQALKDYYRNLGFFNAEIGRSYKESSGYFGIDKPNRWVDVEFIISEGLRSQINEIRFLGNNVFTKEELLTCLKIKSGMYFNHHAIEVDKRKLKEKYGEKGYYYAVIQEDIRYLEQPGKLDIVYMIREFKPAFANSMKVEFDGGQSHTKITTIYDRMDIRPGQPITLENIRESERMLRYDSFLNTKPSEGTVPTIMVIPSDPTLQKLLEQPLDFDDFEENGGQEDYMPLFRGQSPDSQGLNWMIPQTGNVVGAAYSGNVASQQQVFQAGYTQQGQQTPVQQVQYGSQQALVTTPSSQVPNEPVYYQYTAPTPSSVSNTGTMYSGSGQSFPRSVQTTVMSDSTEFLPASLASGTTGTPPQTDQGIFNNPNRSSVYGASFDNSPVSPSAINTPVSQGGYYGDNTEYGSISQVGVTDPWNDNTLAHPYNGPGYGRPTNNLSNVPDYIPSDVIVRVQEGRTGSIMASVMINSDSGLMGRIALQENNFDWKRFPTNPLRFEDWKKAFRGGGQMFLLEAMPGENVQSYNAVFRDPKFLHTRYSFGLNGSYYTRYYDEWRERRLGGGVSLGRAWTNRFSTSVSFNATEVKLYHPISIGGYVPPDIYRSLGKNNLYGFGFSASYDRRDSPVMPTEGSLISGNIEQVIGTDKFLRGGIDLRKYFMLHERLDRSGRWVLGLRSAASVTGDDTPVFERYFAGGASSIRGFEYRGVSPRWFGIPVGGNFEFYNSIELCFPLSFDDNIRGVVFVDSGTVEDKISSWNYDYRVTAGVGLRLCIPAMGPVPIAFDFGVPITKDGSDQTQVFSFTMQFMR